MYGKMIASLDVFEAALCWQKEGSGVRGRGEGCVCGS